ncbi:hypothetical protein VTP01DRAFT_5199 [Rhizomucor pusillus]|uniref:uncharacterized protein n=1 Tax=Rhizomucor pusillus TaxID=4840 RepID=UPI00374325C5
MTGLKWTHPPNSRGVHLSIRSIALDCRDRYSCRKGTAKVAVATSAFGLGVDYQHVRIAIHKMYSSNALNISKKRQVREA